MFLKTAISLVFLLAAQQATAAIAPVKSHVSSTREDNKSTVVKRGGATCKLPSDAGLWHVPGASNAGFAMSPDQECTAGSYCPIACPSGQVMAQWRPGSKYSYPESMDGGLLCGDDGEVSKPFPEKPYCVDGTDAVYAINNVGSTISFCQTVLPGNEAMLIPTIVSSFRTKIAVPDHTYWDGTAAHYYINPPGVGTEGCVWGDSSKPVGNWAPYVAGANTDSSGQTFVKIGWNPIYQFEGNGLEKILPSFGIKIECPDGGCNGLPCSIDPIGGLGALVSLDSSTGAGGSAFCVVTVPKGSSANIVITGGSGSSSEGDSNSASSAAASSSAAPSTTSTTLTSSLPSTSITFSSTSSSVSTTIHSTSSQSTISHPASSSKEATITTSFSLVASTSTKDDYPSITTTSTRNHPPNNYGGLFLENITSTWTSSAISVTAEASDAAATDTASDSSSSSSSSSSGVFQKPGSAPIVSLVVALITAAYFY